MASRRQPGPLGISGSALDRGGTLSRGLPSLAGPDSDNRPVRLRAATGATRDMLGAGRTSAAAAADRVTDAKLAAQDAALASLPAKSEDFVFLGQTYRVIRGIDWREVGPTQRYQMLPLVEAQGIFKAMMAVPTITPGEKSALQTATALLQDTRLGPIEHGLALLRLLPPSSGGSVAAEAPITPSQFRRMLNKSDPAEDKTHWIEIQLVDEDGNPVADESYVITTPDNTDHKGTTDEFGFARLDDIVAGQCKVCFPNLDKDVWSAH